MDPNASVLPASYLLNSFNFVQLGNRTSKALTVTFDGKSWPLPPYPAVILVPPPVATWAFRQHRKLGTENPWNPLDVEYLVYVKDANNKLIWDSTDTPCEQSTAIESIDRSMLPPDLQEVKTLDFGRRVADHVTLPPATPPDRHGGTAAFFDGQPVGE